MSGVGALWQRQCTQGLSEAVHRYLPKVQRNGIDRVPGLPSSLCFGCPQRCPQMKFLPVRHKGDGRDSFAWQRTVKGRDGGGVIFVVVTAMVSWVPPTKRCRWLSKVSPCRCFPSQAIRRVGSSGFVGPYTVSLAVPLGGIGALVFFPPACWSWLVRCHFNKLSPY